ncbi:hypothetical protein DL98DRAFT_29383 [Cadophora sp. DSE1049]|nr:hypothetical protein DL98DRAFT_29383 [Cadophora sp. DSE1049]
MKRPGPRRRIDCGRRCLMFESLRFFEVCCDVASLRSRGLASGRICFVLMRCCLLCIPSHPAITNGAAVVEVFGDNAAISCLMSRLYCGSKVDCASGRTASLMELIRGRTIGDGTVVCDPSGSAKASIALLGGDWPCRHSNLSNPLGSKGLCGLPAKQTVAANGESDRLP